ncbi:MAG TPA: PH domain-containing protein [Chloroflexota bacterium]
MYQDHPSETESTTLSWRPRPSTAGRDAAIAASCLAILAAFIWGYLLSQAVGAITIGLFVISIPVVLFALVMALVAYGYYSMRYEFDSDNLVIGCLWLREVVPLGQVDGVLGGKRLGSRARVEGIAWRGLSIGRLAASELTMPRVYGTTLAPAAMLVASTPRKSYAITPADLDGFKGELIRRLENLPPDEVEAAPEPHVEGSLLPTTSLLGDRTAVAICAACAAVLLLTLAYVVVKLPGLPDLLPLHLGAAGVPDFVVSRQTAFRLPLIGALVLGVNMVGTAVAHAWQRDAGRVLAGATLMVELALLAATVRVVQ